MLRVYRPHDVTEAQRRATRRYLTCAVRASPEKEPATFVALAAHLHASGALQRLQLTPLLLASAQTPYAQELRNQFQQQVPTGVIHQEFLSPAGLTEIFAATRLNVHPCRYDAYGMTVVEAAAQDAPTLMHHVRF